MTAHVTQREPLHRRLRGMLIPAVVAAFTAVAALVQPLPAHAFSRTDTTAESAGVVALSNLPKQAQDTHRRILAGGPFRFDKDGTVFGNRERQLPRQTRGYYREYTVSTPGVRHRGARRIVCGGSVVQSPETCFYTQDHYQSFLKIDPRR
jgi:ribonuclease T1